MRQGSLSANCSGARCAAGIARFDAVVFDPPRQGAQAQVERFAPARFLSSSRVVQRSDVRRAMRDLIDGGYRIECVTPVDQFRYRRTWNWCQVRSRTVNLAAFATTKSSRHPSHRRPSWTSTQIVLGAFMGKMLEISVPPPNAALIKVGDRLGLYKVLAAQGPMTSQQLAAASGTTERCVRDGCRRRPPVATWNMSRPRPSFHVARASDGICRRGQPLFMGAVGDMMSALMLDEPKNLGGLQDRQGRRLE